MAEVSDGERSDMDAVKMSGSRVWAAEETHGVLSRLFRAPKDPTARGSLSYHITAGSLVDVGVGPAPLRATNQTTEALFCKKEVDTRGKSDTRIFFLGIRAFYPPPARLAAPAPFLSGKQVLAGMGHGVEPKEEVLGCGCLPGCSCRSGVAHATLCVDTGWMLGGCEDHDRAYGYSLDGPLWLSRVTVAKSLLLNDSQLR